MTLGLGAIYQIQIVTFLQLTSLLILYELHGDKHDLIVTPCES